MARTTPESGALHRATDHVRFQFWRFRDAVRDALDARAHRHRVFHDIYSRNLWGDPESVSGTGSGVAATAAVRAQLPVLIQELQIKSILDAPCGDFTWMREIANGIDHYVGVDIVTALVARNAERYATDRVTFMSADISAERLPSADLILCRDCFIHLPTRLIRAALRNFRLTGAQYLLLSNSSDAPPYVDIPIGSFRPIDFTRSPFDFPPPIRVINENESARRQLALWKVAQLPLD